MYAIQLKSQGRSFFFHKGQDFLADLSRARLFPSRAVASGISANAFPGSRVVPVETRPALYRIRMKDSLHYLTVTYTRDGLASPVYLFQVGRDGAVCMNREDALELVQNYPGATIVPWTGPAV
jgi:hypothetical protein